MKRCRILLSLASCGLINLTPRPADSHMSAPQAAERRFIGSFAFDPGTRDDVLALLKDHGYSGTYVPENASPDTLLFRGKKADYEAALHFLWKQESQKPKEKPALIHFTASSTIPNTVKQQRNQGPTDQEVLNKVGMSALQKELMEQFFNESSKRMEEFRNQPPSEELIRKGKEFNAWKMKSLKAILTRDQFSQYLSAYGSKPTEKELGPKPELPKIDPKAEKTDEAIIQQLLLSDKQKEAFDKHLQWMKEAVVEMKKPGHDHIAEGQTLNLKWRAGLDRIFTKAQRKQYMDFWGPPPKFAGE